MTSELMIRDMFRSLEATLRERLSMMEDIIIMSRGKNNNDSEPVESLSAKLTTVLEAIQTIDVRLTNLEFKKTENTAETVRVNHIGKLSPDIWTVNAMPGLEIHLNDLPVDHTIPAEEDIDMNLVDEEEEEEVEEEEEEVEEAEEEVEEAEEEVEEEVEEEEEEEVEEAEDAEEAEEAEEGESVEQFEYKGTNYYRDSSNQVYAENEEGDPDDTIVGLWDPVRQRVLFKRTV